VTPWELNPRPTPPAKTPASKSGGHLPGSRCRPQWKSYWLLYHKRLLSHGNPNHELAMEQQCLQVELIVATVLQSTQMFATLTMLRNVRRLKSYEKWYVGNVKGKQIQT
jgi:hypothetical protein